MSFRTTIARPWDAFATRFVVTLTVTVWVLVGSPTRVQAEIADTTERLGAGQPDFATEFQIGNFDDAQLFANFHERIGLIGGLSLVLRQGLGVLDTNELLLGFGAKWTLLSRRSGVPGLAAWAGGHYYTEASVAGIDGTFMVDYRWGRFIPQLGLNFDLEFPDEAQAYLALFGGLHIVVNPNVRWFVEGGAEFLEGRHHVSTGPRITF